VATQHEIKINLPGLLKMLGSNIYAEPDVAVREMIQNAHDTCILRRKEEPKLVPRIDISYERNAHILTFADNGMGMTESELHGYLSTIGQGFTKIQRDALHGAGAQEALLLIGQFGIGMLSAFSVADKVEVYTRSCREPAQGFRWVCEGDIHYTMEPAEIHDPGTRMLLHLSGSSTVLLDDARLRQAIKKYADFLSVPIYLKGNQVNSCTPPWAQEGVQTDYADYIKDRYDLYPLASLPFKLTEPLVLDGLLFIPMIPFELTRDFGEVDVYISRMFIKGNDKAILPTWARFVKGIINSPALTPTVSRDDIVRDASYAQASTALGELILGYLNHLAANDPRLLDTIVGVYNNTMKARSVDDNDFFDQVCELVRVNTSDGFLSMQEYLKRSGGTIYYFSERGTSTQHKLLFARKGLPVIDASWGVEEDFLEKYAARKGAKLERLESDSGIIFKVPETMDEKWHDLERQFLVQLQKMARAVTFEPSSVPAVLVARPIERDEKEQIQMEAIEHQFGLSAGQIQSLFKRMAKAKGTRAVDGDTILQLNTSNPLVQQLRDMNRNETFTLALAAIYNNAQMFAHHYVSPENAEIIFTTNNAAISSMISSVRSLEELQKESAKLQIEINELTRRMPSSKLTEHRSCFFAFDYNVEENYELMTQLQQYFAKPALGVELIAPAKGIHDVNILKSMYDELYSVHFGLAEITGDNPNVFYEAGLLKGLGRPVIMLKQHGTEARVPFDIFSDYRIEYELTKRGGRVKFVWLEDELDKVVKAVFSMSPKLERAQKWNA
jgi:molecular chaperone HtpG